MESTLEVARRAVDADGRRDWATAYALYVQAAAELDAFALSAAGSRAPEELQGARRCAQRACVGTLAQALRSAFARIALAAATR
jgi:hypothetical protein